MLWPGLRPIRLDFLLTGDRGVLAPIGGALHPCVIRGRFSHGREDPDVPVRPFVEFTVTADPTCNVLKAAEANILRVMRKHVAEPPLRHRRLHLPRFD